MIFCEALKSPGRLVCVFLCFLLVGCRQYSSAPPAEPLQKDYSAAEGDAFFTNYHIPFLSITIAGTNLSTLQQSNRTYVRATVQEGAQTWEDVGIHLKGSVDGSFRPLTDKPALTLNFDKFKPKQRFHGLDKIYLNNSVEDDRYMAEHLSGQLFREAGVPAPRVTHAVVTVNDRNRGLYVLKEGFDKSFIRGWFQDATGGLYDSGLVNDIDEQVRQSSGTNSTLASLVAAAKEPDLAKRWEQLQRVLDVDRFISFMAMEILTAHTDGYCLNRNNYRLYHDPSSGKFVFMPHGMDIMFITTDLSIRPPMTGMVARAVMEIPQGRERYENRLSQLFTNVFKGEVLQERINGLEKRLHPVLQEQDAELARKHAIAVESLRLLVSQRIRHVQDELNGFGSLTFDASGFIPLPAWNPDRGYGNHLLEIVKETTNTWLHIRAGTDAPCTASFRTNLVLASGHYRLEGEAKCAGIVALQDGKGTGAGLRISGTSQPRENKLTGDSPVAPLIFEFELQNEDGATEIELICELRATQGEVWFNLGSLKLSKR